MKFTLPDFTHAKVLIVGDIMLDRYWYGTTNRISPEAPVPIVTMNTIEECPGGAANVAMNIATLGAQSYLVGLIGTDDAAEILVNTLKGSRVQCNLVVASNHPTIIKLRILARNQQLIRLDFEKTFSAVDSERIYHRIQKLLPEVDVLVLSDYAKGTLVHVETIISLARKANISILVDPKGTNFSHYYGATLLTPTLHEFEAVVGKCYSEDDIIARGFELIDNHGLSALLITRSENGMTLLQPGKSPFYMPTQAQEVFDVTGAGDTVIGVIASALAAGKTLEESCLIANVAAGIVVGKIGTSTVSSVELERIATNFSEIECGEVNEIKLLALVKKARKCGEKIVMTNGVFDILHAGHVSYLANARKLGDRLIVAVNSDASTRRLKGTMRPINSLINRIKVLSALKTVDWVIGFEENTPQRIIQKVLPDVLVKGGDYQYNSESISGSKEVLEHGGDVRVLNFEEGMSTTKIIQEIIADFC
ncbi:bifunctional D-glycero-beta-D-manno-heptose-7-phosphate kinase/D-glycero-beta-D-manno-heptose 1-phosphate adenylyltransferase HldE [Candidatus Erwinia haradaeae]|uniref:Bifunctional protein HldE n=1 Tax=Candidatus Erwinia haradaeae TaxID=1922217 RepID=A0A451D9S4_9GAMM|nr:bifunctional D-glycero-beta-D-manno-heptose-7-phosphate kinase/D-glycero-beta-D-manno-heptose 1-phosphate adenylyltransferase HldE [Candidatus Erwinia haradaeae]VFP83049.1 Bifunctional protein HldE [Candidatus Erwinia haradaeae]